MAPTPTGPTASRPATAPTARTPPRTDRFRALAALIGGESVESFLNHHFGQDAYRARLDPAVVRGLFGWPQLNAALAEHRLTPPRLRLEQAGSDATKGLFTSRRTRRGAVLQDLDPAVLQTRLREGATLILDAAHELSAPLQSLCAGLGSEFASSCQANLYACWGTTQGFDVHWDDHDVFVVQVEGRKHWALYGSTRAWPTRRDHHAEHRRPETPIEEIVLEPGDMLYLPRGYWHAAVGQGEPTMHLTVGLTRKTGGDFLHWLADHSLTETAVRADLALERDDAVLGEQVATVLASLVGRDPAELGRLYRRHVEANQPQRPKLSFPFIGGEEDLTGASLTLSEGAVRLTAGSTADSVVLSWRGTEFTVAAALETPLRRMIGGASVPVSDLMAAVGEASAGLVEAFVRELARRGVFVVQPGSSR